MLRRSNVLASSFGLIGYGDAGMITTTYTASLAQKIASPEHDRRRGREGSNTCSITSIHMITRNSIEEESITCANV